MTPTSLDFDPGLPRLPVIDDEQAVARLLAGPAAMRARRQDTKYEPGVRCVAGQEVRRTDGTPLLGAVVVLPDGVDAHPLQRDPALPGLAEALDAPAMSDRLGTTCTPLPVRYKPRARCVIRYDAGPEVFYGKVFARGSTAQAGLVTDLAAALSHVDAAPHTVPVIAHWPELGLVLQPAVPHAVEVHALATDPAVPAPRRRATLAGAGHALAALHSCPPIGPARPAADDLAELRGYRPAVAAAAPALGARFRDLVETLAGPAGEPDDAVTTHGAMRTDQLVVAGDRFWLIDLDTVCRAEAARDLGNLLAYLDWKALRRPADATDLAALGQAFLDGYAARRPPPSPPRLAWYRAASLVKIAGRRYRSLTVGEWPRVAELLGTAERLAEQLPAIAQKNVTSPLMT